MKNLHRFVDGNGNEFSVPDDELEQFSSAMAGNPVSEMHRFTDKDNRIYNVPDKDLEAFHAAMPDARAVRSIRTMAGDVDVADGDERGFLRDYHADEAFKMDREASRLAAQDAQRQAQQRQEAAHPELAKNADKSFGRTYAEGLGVGAASMLGGVVEDFPARTMDAIEWAGRNVQRIRSMPLRVLLDGSRSVRNGGSFFDGAMNAVTGPVNDPVADMIHKGAEGYRGLFENAWWNQSFDEEYQGVASFNRSLGSQLPGIMIAGGAGQVAKASALSKGANAAVAAARGADVANKANAIINVAAPITYGGERFSEVYHRAIENGMPEQQALLLANAAGGLEAGMEYASEKLGFGKARAKAISAIDNGVKSNIGKWIASKAVDMGLEIPSESITEFVQEGGGYLIDQIADGVKLSELSRKDLLEAATVGKDAAIQAAGQVAVMGLGEMWGDVRNGNVGKTGSPVPPPIAKSIGADAVEAMLNDPDAARLLVATDPVAFAKLAAKKNPSRKDFEALGINVPAEMRAKIAERIRDVLPSACQVAADAKLATAAKAFYDDGIKRGMTEDEAANYARNMLALSAQAVKENTGNGPAPMAASEDGATTASSEYTGPKFGSEEWQNAVKAGQLPAAREGETEAQWLARVQAEEARGVVAEETKQAEAEPIAETPAETPTPAVTGEERPAETPAPAPVAETPKETPAPTQTTEAEKPKAAKNKGKGLTGYKALDRAIRKDAFNERVMAFDVDENGTDQIRQSFVDVAKAMYEGGLNGKTDLDVEREIMEGSDADMKEAMNSAPPYLLSKYNDMGASEAQKSAPTPTNTPVAEEPNPQPQTANAATEDTTDGTATNTFTESGDINADLAALAGNPDALKAMFDDALAEAEAENTGTAEATEPKTKTVNKGKGPVQVPVADDTAAAGTTGTEATAPTTAPTPTVNKGKGPVPVKTGGMTRAQKEAQALAEASGGTLSADDAAVLADLFGVSGEISQAAEKIEGMAALPADAPFNENVYNRVRPIFERAVAAHKDTRSGVKGFIGFVARTMGPGARPYLERFIQDLAKENNNGQTDGAAGATGGGNGVAGGRNADAGQGPAQAGGPAGADGGRAGSTGTPAGDQGAGRPVPAGMQDGGRGGEGNGVPGGDDGVAGHGTAGSGVRPAPGSLGNGLATENADAAGVAGQPSVVRAPNGNLDTRNSPPVRLSKGQRVNINAQVAELVQKPVGSLTDEEIDILRQFTGAGGLGYRGQDIGTQIKALNQHFTDYSVVDAMWNALEKAGVPMNDVCEPAGGSGNFPGRRPGLNWTLCELDPIAAGVLKHLFPGAKVQQGTFEDVKLPQLQDVFISNVPFLEQRNHANRPDIKALHDFFFVHALKQTKPNGVVAFITSRGTMDKADTSVRKELVESGDIIGAFRLPQGTFAANAGTDVTTDVIFIQKRPDGVAARPEAAARNQAFVDTVTQVASDGETKMRISKYYESFPEGILGQLVETKQKLYGGRPVLDVVASEDAPSINDMAIDYKPYPVASQQQSGEQSGNGTGNASSSQDGQQEQTSKYPHNVADLVKTGARFELSDGNTTYSQNIRMYDGVPHAVAEEFTLDGFEEGTHTVKVFEPITGDNAAKIAALQRIVDDVAKFQDGDTMAAEDGIAAIAEYKEKYGGIHPSKDKALKKLFKDAKEDLYLRELSATFDEDFNPAESLSNRVRYEGSGEKQAGDDSSLIDQALASENTSGEIHLGDNRCKITADDIPDLLQSGYSISGFENGNPVIQNNVLFESGDIYKKLDRQRELRKQNPKYAAMIDKQIATLESKIPTPKVFDAIFFKGNEGWKTGKNGRTESKGWIAPILAEAGIEIDATVNKNGMREFFVSTIEKDAEGNSTGHRLLSRDEEEILAKHFTSGKLVMKDKDESDASYLRREREAESSLAEIYGKIRAKVAEDPDRVSRIERAYNERYNGYVKPDWSKAEYLIKDTIEAFRDAGVQLRPNQTRWVAQALVEGVGINAHDVGGGKTLAAMALAYALKQRGVCKKPMFVVPSKTIKTSWLSSDKGMQKLFPNAKIFDLGSLPAKTRAKQLFEIANSNADAIFISHEGFEAIQLPPGDEIAALREYADDLIDATGDRNEAKARESLEAYIREIEKEPRDTRLTFDKLGVDCLIVDEAHNYKNVGVSSPLAGAGLGITFSADVKESGVSIKSHRSHDFRFKADWVADHNNGRNVFLLTATPTPNKPIELYTMLRHLGRRVLGEYGIFTDRDFSSKFFETGIRECPATKGGTTNKQILTKLVDVFALKDIMGRYIDRIPMSAFASQNITLPEVSRETKFVDMSSDMEAVQDDIITRVASAASSFQKEKGDDTIIGAFMNGRDAAVTPYVYVGPHANVHVEGRSHDPETDKIEYAIQETVHEINAGKKEGKPRTVLIFSDVMGGKDGQMSVPEDIKRSLIERGMDPKEIAIVTGEVCTNPATGKEVKASGKKAQELKGEIQDAFAPKGENGQPPPPPSVKVIIGSTATIGEGLNLNTWTSLAINLDIPLTPGASKQREGRLVRFGNQHSKVRIMNLVTRGSFDTLSLSISARKQGWNQAIWAADVKESINVEDEMSGGGGVDPQEIIIASIRDPIRRQEERVKYDLSRMQTAIDQARGQLSSVQDRILTQERNIKLARAGIDERTAAIANLKHEAERLSASIPALREKAIASLDNLKEFAKTSGDTEAVNKLEVLVKATNEARAASVEAEREYKVADKAKVAASRKYSSTKATSDLDAYSAATKAEEAAKKAWDDAKHAIADARRLEGECIAEMSKDAQPLARMYQKNSYEIAETEEKARRKLESVPYNESVVRSRERDIAAAEARIKELDVEREKAETEWKRTIQDRAALGREWYTDFGGEHQAFNVEKATLKAEMDAANASEDESEDWMGERQVIEAMPAPKKSGTKPLNNGKLPDPTPVEATGTEKPKYATSKGEIFRLARELFPELHITDKGTYHKQGVLGWFEVENRVIRTIDPRGIGELCHELGHAIAHMSIDNGVKIKMEKVAQREFFALGKDLYGDKRPAGGYIGEGVAEFTRGFLCDYDLAKEFPEAHKWFFETFGKNNPEFMRRLFVLKGKILDYTNMAPEHAIRSMWDHSRPVGWREIPWIRRVLDYDFKTEWVDSNWPILRAMNACGADYNFHDPSKSPEERAELILNHPYMLATFFQGKALRFAETDALECTTSLYGDKTGKSLQAIVEPLAKAGKENLKQFWDYAVAMRGKDYEAKGLKFGRSSAEIAAAIAKYGSAENEAALQEVTDWSHRELHLLVEAGAITEDEYEKICEANPVYVPIARVFEENEINERRMKAGKRALFGRKGGSRDIEAPAVALVEMAARIRQAAMQAKIVNSLVDMYDRAKSQKSKTINQFMVEVPNPVKKETMWADKIKDQIAHIASARLGADDATIAAALKDTWTEELFCFTTKAYDGKQNIVSIHDRDGKLRSFEVRDKQILDLLAGYTKAEKLSAGSKVYGFIANGIRMGATVLKGSFSLVANPIRDAATAFHMSEYGVQIPVISTLEGMVNSVLNTDLAKCYLRLGGDMGTFYQGGRHAAAKSIASQVEESNKFMRAMKKGLFTLVGDVMSLPEIGPRLMAFRNAKNYWTKQGVGETAANFVGRLCGGDITIDFGRAGHSARYVNKVILFFNAAVRELDHLARASGLARQLPWQNPGKINWRKVNRSKNADAEFSKQSRKGHAARFWTRGLALTGFALIAWLLNRWDDERKRKFKELKPEYKWNNTVVGNVRLPVPFLDGLIFQSLPVAILESFDDGSVQPVKEVGEQMVAQLPVSLGDLHQLARNISAFSPEIDLIANEDWRGDPIVPSRMLRMQPRDQRNENSTWLAKALGDAWNVSPIKIDYFIDQHTGGLVSGMMRDFENTKRHEAWGVNGDYSKLPVVGRIFLAPFTTNRLVGEFYDKVDELNQAYASHRLDAEGLGRLRAMEEVQEDALGEYSAIKREILALDKMPVAKQKECADRFSKAMIDTVRRFNEADAMMNYRLIGIEAAAVGLSSASIGESSTLAYEAALADVDPAEAIQALKRYGKKKGWSRETMSKRQRALVSHL